MAVFRVQKGSVDEMTRLTQEVWREVKENW